MTDLDTLTEIKYHLIEDNPTVATTIPSLLWTIDEVVEALTTAQDWVLRQAGPRLTRATLVTLPNLNRYMLPQDWVVSARVSWEQADHSFRELPRDSSWSADYLDYTWTTTMTAAPTIYTDTDSPIPSLQVMPAAYDNGLLHILYVALGTPLTGTGVSWTLPDLLVPMAKWKALAILLAKDGRGQDVPRATVALQRATEGMTALSLFLNGWATP